MAPLPVIADIQRVAFEWLFLGQRATNVLHFSAPGLSESDVFTIINNHVTATMFAAVSQNADIGTVEIEKLDGVSARQTFTTVGAKWAGQGGTQGSPAMAALIKLTTATRGRSHRGRIFLPYVAEDTTSNGFVDATPRATSDAAWVAFANACVADGAALGVASYKLASWEQATTVTAEAALGTQRRRQERNR